ncbi:MAG: pilus assembly protein [Syntrophomonadaceae bacterium]|nr:pilus assembly protein [Syntrophomonadaceae bacterium]
MRKFAGFFKSMDGQALVEMAVTLPVLLLLFMGIFEFGRILGAYMIISDLAREGARYGVVGHDDAEIETLVSSRHAWLDGEKINIIITPPFAEREKGEALTVKIDYAVDLLTPFLSNILPNPVQLSSQCLMRVE